MPYLVTKINRKPDLPSVYDLLNHRLTERSFIDEEVDYTRTYFYKDLTPKTDEQKRVIESYISMLMDYVSTYNSLLENINNDCYDYEKQVKLESKWRKELSKEVEDKKLLNQKIKENTEKDLNDMNLKMFDLYYTFYRPKKKRDSHGNIRWRRIDAPSSELSNAQRKLANLFSVMMNGNTYHTAAYAYIKGRDIVKANIKHQKHGSRFSLQLDFSDFFGSTTLDFVYKMMSMIFPFSEIVKDEKGKKALKKCLEICFLDGRLPQGTPISPLITNIMMIPIDHKIQNDLYNVYNAVSKGGVRHKFVYTRYADDIKISNRINFKSYRKNGKIYSNVKNEDGKVIDIEKWIIKILKSFKAPFSINESKTKYTSIYGNNWSLGILTNQYNKLSLGHKSKDLLSSKLWDFANHYINGEKLNPKEAQKLYGIVNYHMYVEREKTVKIKQNICKKLHITINIDDMLKDCISN